jgi:hypothetical protein
MRFHAPGGDVQEVSGGRFTTAIMERPVPLGAVVGHGQAAVSDIYEAGGYRRMIIGPDHPYFAGGLPMDAPGVGVGQNDGFVFQARAFLEEVAGIDEADSLPRNASFDEGVHNMEILAAVAESAVNGGAAVKVAPHRAEAMR